MTGNYRGISRVRQGKIAVLAAAAVLLAGCQTDEDFMRPFHAVFGSGPPPKFTPEATSQSPFDARCRELAQERADDARFRNYDAAVQNTVFQGTYKDCIAFDEQHRPQ